MIKGIGTDIIEIKKIKKYSENETFLNKVFTKNELEYAKKEKFVSHLATIFSTKEAFFKALGTGWIDGKEIEIVHNKKGQPKIKLKGNLSKKVKGKVMHSTSFCEKYAVSFVIIKK